MAAFRGKKIEQTPLLEWIAASVGLIFLAVVLVAIGHDAMTGTYRSPPAIAIKQGTTMKVEKGFVVSFTAYNRSGGTAAALEVEGQLKTTDGQVETSSATIDYVPGHGQAEGGVYFQTNPARGQLTLRPLGFQRP